MHSEKNDTRIPIIEYRIPVIESTQYKSPKMVNLSFNNSDDETNFKQKIFSNKMSS